MLQQKLTSGLFYIIAAFNLFYNVLHIASANDVM